MILDKIKKRFINRVKSIKYYIFIALFLVTTFAIVFIGASIEYIIYLSIIIAILYFINKIVEKLLDKKRVNNEIIINVSHSIKAPTKVFNILTTNIYTLNATIKIEAFYNSESRYKYEESIERQISKDDIDINPIKYLESQLNIIIENSLNRFISQYKLPDNIKIIDNGSSFKLSR